MSPKLHAILAITATGLLLSTVTNSHSSVVIIEMTANGFEPRQVTVDTETILNFANKDDKQRWPASNIHPTHDLYPEFDPKQPIEPGDFWIFKPSREGIWKFHDHLFPHMRGTITVVPEEISSNPKSTEQPDDTRSSKPSFRLRLRAFFINLFQSIAGLFTSGPTDTSPTRSSAAIDDLLDTSDFTALPELERYQYLDTLNQSQGLPATWTYVKSAYTDESGSSLGGPAHDAAHYVGGVIYQDAGIEGLSLCDPTFAFGCYHGFTETAFAQSLDLLPDIVKACRGLGSVGSGPWSSCIHGIGHGVATFYDSVELQAALAECDQLQEGATYCHDGVFMEFSFTAPPIFYKEDQPLYPCSQLSEEYQHACGRNQTSVMRSLFKMNSEQIAATCATGHHQLLSACIDSLGFSIAGAAQGNPQAIITQCQIFTDPSQHAQCVSAAAGELVFQNFQGWQQVSPAACALLQSQYQEQCHQRVQRTVQNYQR